MEFWMVVPLAGGLLALRVGWCGCGRSLSDKDTEPYRGKRSRELYEAQAIKACGDVCVSEPSVSLSDKELLYLHHPT
uniref:Putative secreted protein n=1 Tax=Ixodes ricinus TaxID=34613 RepID=A0A147BMT2_IXORI